MNMKQAYNYCYIHKIHHPSEQGCPGCVDSCIKHMEKFTKGLECPQCVQEKAKILWSKEIDSKQLFVEPSGMSTVVGLVFAFLIVCVLLIVSVVLLDARIRMYSSFLGG